MVKPVDYPNAKLRFVAWLFGPLINQLESRNISGAFVGILFGALFIYLLYFRGITKGRRISWQGKAYFAIWLGLLILAVLDQIDLFRNPRR